MIEFRSADRAPEICPSSSNKVRAADMLDHLTLGVSNGAIEGHQP
ncbi:hypothetical protein ABIF65_011680 [Bradyrhizobium japonicum]